MIRGHDSGYDSRKCNMHVIINFVYAISGIPSQMLSAYGGCLLSLIVGHHGISHCFSNDSDPSFHQSKVSSPCGWSSGRVGTFAIRSQGPWKSRGASDVQKLGWSFKYLNDSKIETEII